MRDNHYYDESTGIMWHGVGIGREPPEWPREDLPETDAPSECYDGDADTQL